MDFLGLVTFFVCGEVANIFDKVAIREHFQNLCAKIGVKCKEHFAGAQTATQTGNWVVAYAEWTSCRDIIVRSEGLLDRNEWHWLSGCQELVSANLWAFHSKNFELALDASIEAWQAWFEYDNASEALSFESYLAPTLCTMIYLWATSDCEEEALDLNVKSFLMKLLSHPRDAVPDSEVRTLKQQCKEFVIYQRECVIWEVQQQYFYYFETEECLRWAREGNKVYAQKYPGKLDYVSKLNEATTLFMSGACEEVIKVCEKIRETLELELLQANDTHINPAAQFCTLEYVFMVSLMLYVCYGKMILKPYHRTRVMIEQYQKARGVCNSLLSHGNFLSLRECLDEAWEHAVNDRYGVDVYRVCSW
jgi:hypothetical protein